MAALYVSFCLRNNKKKEKEGRGRQKLKNSEKISLRTHSKIEHKRTRGEKKGRPPAPIMSNLIKAAAGAAG